MRFLSSPGGGGVTVDPSSLVFDIPQLLVATSFGRERELSASIVCMGSAGGQNS